jgi:hypothetical protein
MNLTLKRQPHGYLPDGILSRCYDDLGNQVFVTLEHPYMAEGGTWQPKIPPGTYTCARGMHRLDGMAHDFETFEVTGVSGHSGLLFHAGNWNRNSKGCILPGEDFATDGKGEDMVVNSRTAFSHFMKLQAGQDSFRLTVIA